MRKVLLASLCAAGVVGAAMPAAAADMIVLDFAGNICGIAGTASCGNGTRIGGSYGSTAQLGISYRSVTVSTGLTYTDYLEHWSGNYGNLTNVVYGGANATNYRSEITFTPISGFEVQLLSFDAACYLNRVSCRTMNYTLSNSGGTLASASGLSTMHPGHVDVSVNSAWSSSPLLLAWGPDGYDVGLDNITLAVRAIDGGTDIVPEPASWAMLIAGFGMIGGAMRRRTGLARVTA
ncbi:hypothetical protein FHS79_001711 [Polymorphobacter multimanifer]|uniref:Ice-binding protein C-terminal domain-containing protein n=1 Tax=Polymorphobacter multimanifer TaxID=1070431 RepID=A0A841LEF7_9SPHN|nr:PEPxxWA-CTERM sorting domain-containing protein [Polymorphobacter multimanifer]MBB6227542.1 hypothetical protein [Polymorphobacter multimanifer]